MLFADNPNQWDGWTIDIIGTDVSSTAIKAAQRACYTQFEIQRGLGVTQMLTHFDETSRGWEPSATLRNMTRFKVRNILEPAGSMPRIDLALCRNVLLYFDDTRRSQAFDRIAEAMREDGWLMLGAGETSISQTSKFRAVEGNQGLHMRNLRTIGSGDERQRVIQPVRKAAG
jgi:chemotaxis protein methyltransferase CheR